VNHSIAPLKRELAEAAYELHAGVESALGEALAELELTIPLADLLWRLDPAAGPLPRRTVAERLRCDPSNVTFLVDRLEQRELVRRARSRDDRRVRALSLTPAGVRVRHRLIAAIAHASLFTGLSASEQRQLLGLLGRCIDLGC
jgi:DNA-binding MarR family transcriptional regulator